MAVQIRACHSSALISRLRVQARAQRLRSIDQWQPLETMLDQRAGIAAVSPIVSGPAFAVRGDANKSVAVQAHVAAAEHPDGHRSLHGARLPVRERGVATPFSLKLDEAL